MELSAGPWDFGWEALVAIATFTLASATVALAGMTYWVGRETRSVAKATQEEIQATWRPVLILEDADRPSGSGFPSAVSFNDERLAIHVKNCGPGAALHVNATLGVLAGPEIGEPQRIAIAPGASAIFSWWPPEGKLWEVSDVAQIGELSYCDVSYTGYETSFSIKPDENGGVRIDWQRVDDDPSYVPELYGP